MLFNGPGDMTKMAAMPINGKTLKIFSSGTKRPMTLKVGICCSTTMFVQMMALS